MAEWRRSSFRRSTMLEVSSPLERLVDLDQPVRDRVDVVHALDVGAAGVAELPSQLERLDERTQLVHEVVFRRRDDRHLHAERALRLLDGFRVESRDDGLAVREA